MQQAQRLVTEVIENRGTSHTADDTSVVYRCVPGQSGHLALFNTTGNSFSGKEYHAYITSALPTLLSDQGEFYLPGA